MRARYGQNPVLKGVRRFYSLLAFYCWVKPRSHRTVETRLLGFTLVIPPSVFHPRYYFTSKFLGDYLKRQDFNGKRILDLGSGSGILSLAAASAGARLTSLDINPLAVASTRTNAEMNNLGERILATEGDLFESLDFLGERFDHIISNPPYYPGRPQNMAERAFKGGVGNEFMVKLASVLPHFLRPEGSLLVVLSSDVDAHALLQPFEECGCSITTVATKKLLFETLVIVEIRCDEPNSRRRWSGMH